MLRSLWRGSKGLALDLAAVERSAEAGRVGRRDGAVPEAELAREGVVVELVKEVRLGRPRRETRDRRAQMHAHKRPDAAFGVGADHRRQIGGLAQRNDLERFGDAGAAELHADGTD